MNNQVRLKWGKAVRVLPFSVLFMAALAFGAFAPPQSGNAASVANAAEAPSPSALPDVLVPSAIYPGQAFLVSVRGNGLESVEFIWRKKSLRVPARTDSGPVPVSEILLPLPYEEKTGRTAILRLRVTVNGETVPMERKIPIKYKKYPEQALSVDSRFVKLNKKDLERSKRERAETLPVLNAFTPERSWSLPFRRSVPGNLRGGVSGHFGLRRVFNGEPRGHHRGLDLRGAQGTPIRACADGTVAIAANHFFSGNVVYIDHGQGVVTMYAHMSRIAAKPGQRVKAGDVIGYVGSTGRVTGPHLHLGLCVQGVSVDVLPFLEKDKPGPAGAKRKSEPASAKPGTAKPASTGAASNAGASGSAASGVAASPEPREALNSEGGGN